MRATITPLVYQRHMDTEAVAVLRDWQLEHDRKADMHHAGPHALRNCRELPFPPQELLATAARALFDPGRLERALRNRHPRAKEGLLTAEQIAAGIALHGEALLLAERMVALWVGPALVSARGWLGVLTTIHHHVSSPGDVVVLGGPEVSVGRRTLHRIRPPDARIYLPRLWWHEDRTAPWEPVPEGWEMAGNRQWIKRRLVLPGEEQDGPR